MSDMKVGAYRVGALTKGDHLIAAEVKEVSKSFYFLASYFSSCASDFVIN